MRVDMIAEFSPEGKVTPLRLRLKEDGEYQVFDILHPVLVDTKKSLGNVVMKYKAKIMVNGAQKTVDLYFESKNTRWDMKIW